MHCAVTDSTPHPAACHLPTMTTKTLSDARRKAAQARKTHSGGHNGGSPRTTAPRCACDRMTLARAIARGTAHTAEKCRAQRDLAS